MPPPHSRTLKDSEFTANCRQLIDEVAATGEEIIVTKQGKPFGKFVPVEQSLRAPWGLFASEIEILGDIVSPIDSDLDAESDPERLSDT